MKKETYQSQKAFAGEKKPSMKRRFVGHDYTKRGIYMLTMAVEGRRPLFGRVYGSSDDARIELSELGCAVRDEWWNIPSYYPQVKVFELQMMPDHLHGILFVSEPLSCGLSGVVRGFKTGCGRAYRRLIAPLPVATESQQTVDGNHPGQQTMKGSHPEHGLLFEPGYNDLVLRTDDEYQRWKHYLRDNPRRLLMKRERPELLHPFFDLQLGSRRYNGIGNRAACCSAALGGARVAAPYRRAVGGRSGPLYGGRPPWRGAYLPSHLAWREARHAPGFRPASAHHCGASQWLHSFVETPGRAVRRLRPRAQADALRLGAHQRARHAHRLRLPADEPDGAGVESNQMIISTKRLRLSESNDACINCRA